MSSLDDRKRYRRAATLTMGDVALVFGWSCGGLLLQLALIAHAVSVVPVWTT